MRTDSSSTAHVLSLTLEFDEEKLIVGKDTDIRRQLSGVAFDGDHLWLACDEGCRLERLSHAGAQTPLNDHQNFQLHDLLSMPAPPKEEADIEGLHVDEGWLWLVGSHSLKRKKPKGDSAKDVAERLAETGRDGNRHVLARVPLIDGRPQKAVERRRAARLGATADSSALLDAIRAAEDPHLEPFLDIPGKDNGFDIEGLAARGMRAWVGLRGPVLREWCCVLELRLAAHGDQLALEPLEGSSYRKHFFKLNGLGVRDLAPLGDDLLILAGPSMAHDGPCEIWRWAGGTREGASVSSGDLRRVAMLPQRDGVDRAEGLAVYEHGDGATLVLVVFDSPAPERLLAASSVKADVYRLV